MMNAHKRLKEINSILSRVDIPLQINVRELLEVERRGIILGLECKEEEDDEPSRCPHCNKIIED